MKNIMKNIWDTIEYWIINHPWIGFPLLITSVVIIITALLVAFSFLLPLISNFIITVCNTPI